jgi:hypothetical protein
MKTFFELRAELLEATLASRLKSSRSAAAPVRRRSTPRPSSFPWWTKNGTGWWNISGKSVTLASDDMYHITAVFKRPEAFGLTREKILHMLEEWRSKYSPNNDPERLYLEFFNGKRDWNIIVAQYLFNNGWVRVRTIVPWGSGPTMTLHGKDKDTRKAAAACLPYAPSSDELSYLEVSNETNSMGGNFKMMKSIDDMERYARGS